MSLTYFHYPGIDNPLEGSYVCAHGREPGRCVIRAPIENQNPAPVGDLVIVQNGQQVLRVRDMRLVNADNTSNEGGNTVEYTLLDRRCFWGYGEVYIDDAMTRSGVESNSATYANQFAQDVLLPAMGEQSFDVSLLPNEELNYRSFNYLQGAFTPSNRGRGLNGANPSALLEELADKYSMRLVYDPLSDTVAIRNPGQGAGLPQHVSLRDVVTTRVGQPIPSGIRVLGEYVRFQSYLPLEAVGIEEDGSIVPIDQLTYTPSSGWEKQGEYFHSLDNDRKKKLLALQSVYRWYRVKRDFERPIEINVDGLSFSFNSAYNILDLDGDLYKNSEGKGAKNADGSTMETEAFIRGTYWYLDDQDQAAGRRNVTTEDDPDEKFKLDFSLDSKNMIVKFGRQVFQVGDDEDGFSRKPAELYLYASYHLRVPSPSANGQSFLAKAVFSYLQELQPDTPRSKVDIVRDPEGDLQYWVARPADTAPDQHVSSWTSNLSDDGLIGKAQTLAVKHAERYAPQDTAEATYNALLPVQLDGAIQSVTWSFGSDGAMTQVSRNTEPDYILTKHKDRVEVGKIKRKVREL